jgi:hypothetical protein
MDFLPSEILAAIFEEVNDIRDLRNVRSASRTLCAAATPIAFRFIFVVTTQSSAQNLGRLFDVPEIAAYIREVSYRDTGADPARRGRRIKYGASSTPHPVNDISVNLPWRVMPVRPSVISELACLFSRVHQLPRLETINLTFNAKWFDPDGKGRLPLQESIVGALAASFTIRAPPMLTSLSLYNLCPFVIASLDSPPFQTVLKTLRRLQLFMILDRILGMVTPLDHCQWCHFWSTLCPRTSLAPMQHSLTELTLHSTVYLGASSGLSLRELHFPRLCALTLGNIVFDRSIGAEYFVLRHASTLARLELRMCKLPTNRHQQLLPIPGSSTILAMEDESGFGLDCWHGIWDRFSAELTALVVLRVDERRSNPSVGTSSECRYVNPGTSVAYWEIDVPEPRNVADAEALRRFQTTVAARSEEMRRKS